MSTNHSNQLWLRIFLLFQNLGRIGWSVIVEKCSKIDFLPSRIFLDFSSPCIYFSCAESYFCVFLKKWKALTCGAHLSAAKPPGLAAWGGTCAVKAPRSDHPVSKAPCLEPTAPVRACRLAVQPCLRRQGRRATAFPRVATTPWAHYTATLLPATTALTLSIFRIGLHRWLLPCRLPPSSPCHRWRAPLVSVAAAALALPKLGSAPLPHALLTVDHTAMLPEPRTTPPWPALLPPPRKRRPLREASPARPWATARGQSGKAMGRACAMQAGNTSAVPLGREQIPSH
jgi:hypothetical protein